jgi:hypothetical protein
MAKRKSEKPKDQWMIQIYEANSRKQSHTLSEKPRFFGPEQPIVDVSAAVASMDSSPNIKKMDSSFKHCENTSP